MWWIVLSGEVLHGEVTTHASQDFKPCCNRYSDISLTLGIGYTLLGYASVLYCTMVFWIEQSLGKVVFKSIRLLTDIDEDHTK